MNEKDIPFILRAENSDQSPAKLPGEGERIGTDDMGKIFYIMGKSATGKDTIYQELLERKELGLNRLIPYTTRPIRAKETEGVEYHFVGEEKLQEFLDKGRVIELREYDTIHGIWKYFTVDDETMDLEKQDYLAIGTLVSYGRMVEYYGKNRVIPIYIEVEDGERLERALKREKKQTAPKYEELCRRFLADQKDFSDQKLEAAGIGHRFSNNGDRQQCMEEAAAYILSQKEA